MHNKGGIDHMDNFTHGRIYTKAAATKTSWTLQGEEKHLVQLLMSWLMCCEHPARNSRRASGSLQGCSHLIEVGSLSCSHKYTEESSSQIRDWPSALQVSDNTVEVLPCEWFKKNYSQSNQVKFPACSNYVFSHSELKLMPVCLVSYGFSIRLQEEEQKHFRLNILHQFTVNTTSKRLFYPSKSRGDFHCYSAWFSAPRKTFT